MATREEIGDEIVQTALRFVGLYEKQSNSVWDDPGTAGTDPQAAELRSLMERCGWQAGWPYCAAFCEAMWRSAYQKLGAPETLMTEIAWKLTPSVMQSFNNWARVPGPQRISQEPIPGAIFFMQKGQSGFGHAGIVARATEGKLATIEGNTIPDPKDAETDREGDGIFKRTRSLDFTPKPGLWLRGFLPPIPFEKT